MKKSLLAVVAITIIACAGLAPQQAVSGEPKSPVEGFDIHVQAPHMMANGEPGGPFHHYCKGISDKILQCLLFESTDPKAKLVAIEYFVAKELTRKMPPIQWHRFFHDHKVEVAEECADRGGREGRIFRMKNLAWLGGTIYAVQERTRSRSGQNW
jgi:hypothetical protein